MSELATPRLEIALQKIYDNTVVVSSLCQQHGIRLVGITKGCGGLPEVAEAMVQGGATAIGDSRLRNLRQLGRGDLNVPLQLIRSPSLSQVEQVVELADLSLNTEPAVVEKLGQAARRKAQTHQVILMLELGENREGIADAEIDTAATVVEEISGVELIGLGATLGCRAVSYPTRQQVTVLLETRQRVESTLGRTLDITSLGGSGILPLLVEGDCPSGLTHLRIGEGILLGLDAIEGHRIPGTHRDAFHLVAEVIEVRSSHECEDDQHVILALGYQDTDIGGLEIQLPGAQVDIATSDHLVLTFSSKSGRLSAGDEVGFVPNYHALVRLCTSPYVSKVFVD